MSFNQSIQESTLSRQKLTKRTPDLTAFRRHFGFSRKSCRAPLKPPLQRRKAPRCCRNGSVAYNARACNSRGSGGGDIIYRQRQAPIVTAGRYKAAPLSAQPRVHASVHRARVRAKPRPVIMLRPQRNSSASRKPDEPASPWPEWRIPTRNPP